MVPVSVGIPIDRPGVTRLDPSQLKTFKLHEAPEDLFQSMIRAQEKMLEWRHTTHPDTSQHPAYKEYATVEVGGKVVARIDNHGFVRTSNALGARLSGQLPGDMDGQTGPLLAQVRAEHIAALLGGKVRKSSDALTQGQFMALAGPRFVLDHEAMKEDPLYLALQNTKEARVLFLAQQAEQSAAPE